MPVRRESQKPFFRSALGRRLIMYLFGIGIAGSMLKSIMSPPPQDTETPDTRPAVVALTNPPRAIAPPEVLHQLRTIDDFSRQPHPGAIGAALAFMQREGPTESRPSNIDWTDLDIDQAIAHPTEFRGGLFRVRGAFMGVETLGPHPTLNGEYTYRGYLLCSIGEAGRRRQAMVIFETLHAPAEFEKGQDTLEVEGVFLQVAQYEDKKGGSRASPFLVTGAARKYDPPTNRGFFKERFSWIVVVLIILVLVTAYFLLRKSRTPSGPDRFASRPPGPGR
jgi:hypothetical protein